MLKFIVPIFCVIGSVAFGYLRVDGYRSEAFQAFAHFWVCGLFVSGARNAWAELVSWWQTRKMTNGGVFMKCSFAGPKIFYPVGQHNDNVLGQIDPKNNQNIAKELVEKFERGWVVALPAIQPNWQWECPRPFPTWSWYQLGLAVALTILETIMALKTFGVI